MSLYLSQLEKIESGTRRIAARMPELPVQQTLAMRLSILLGRELSARLDQTLRPSGLTEVELRALFNIFSHAEAGTYPGAMCSALCQSPANVTRVTDALVARGLVTRVPSDEDRRRTELRITVDGEALVRELLPVFSSSARDLFAGFKPEELDQLLGVLRRIFAALDGHQQDVPTEQVP
ncbi:MAG: hypothetical protein RLZZ200_1892 [Pseudomonadota bacterium]